jgi:diguanylate cyclase (GGDEF)-like protein
MEVNGSLSDDGPLTLISEPASPARGRDPRDIEAIRTPSAIQSHGILLAVRESDLRVVHISANAKEFLGISPVAALGRSLPDILGSPFVALIVEAVSEGRTSFSRRITVSLPAAGNVGVHMFAHRSDDLICVELEPTSEKQCWEVHAQRMEGVIEGLRRPETVSDLCVAAARELRNLTGYDHVMIYRIQSDHHGQVIAEDKVEQMPAQLHWHFPESEFPAQTRALYLRQRTLMVADVGAGPIPLLTHSELSQGAALDMTHCGLQSAPLARIECLKAMGVASSFTIALVHQEKLWGLVICNHRSSRLMAPEVRALCEVLGGIISMLIGVTESKESYAEHLSHRGTVDQLASLMPPGTLLAEVLSEHPSQFLGLLEAGGALAQFQGHSRLAGITPSLEESLAMMKAMRGCLSADGIVALDAVRETLPQFAHLANVASGALMISIGASQTDGILWFRPERVEAIRWGGSLAGGKSCNEEPRHLRANESLSGWRETQRGRARPWADVDTSTARDLQRILIATMLRHADVHAQLSYVDALTSLPNRRVLLDRLAARRKAQPGNPDSLIFIDIDRFKMVNDTLGHAAGDDLLIQVSRRLTECVGAQHLVARLGGDEFVVLCEDVALEAATLVAHRLISSFQHPFCLNGSPFHCMASVGLAPAGGAGMSSVADVLHAADSAMYAAKQRGGNQFVIFESPLHEKLMRQMKLEQDIFLAMDRQELKVHFQPQISVGNCRLIGFEALSRWEHPLYGNIPPSEFIPMAERTGYISNIGSRVLFESLRQLSEWRKRHSPDLFMSVNISIKQLLSGDLVDVVKAALDVTRVPGEALHIEVTESLLMEKFNEMQLHELQSLGVQISIDDFGTGYSSLSYLHSLAIRELKLDRTFIEDVGTDERKTVLFGGIVNIAHLLGLTVVAEGIEMAAQFTQLQACACDVAQGYLFCKPISAETAERLFLGEWKRGFSPKGS